MQTTRILACDIDGTLLEDGRPTPGLRALRRRLAGGHPNLRLVYATGRTFRSTQKLIRLGILPPPDAVAAQVGTELWLPPWTEPLPEYAQHIARGWHEKLVRARIAAHPALTLQERRYQTPWKVSAFVEPEEAPRVVPALRAELAGRGLAARLIHSGRRYLDLVPQRSGKLGALRFLSRLYAAEPTTEILACGDSGNDLDMLSTPQTAGVVVGNATDPTLAALGALSHVYHARQPHAAGVVEGGQAFGFWSA